MFDEILPALRVPGPQQIAALQQLVEVLIFAEELPPEAIPLPDLCMALCQILNSSRDAETLVPLFQCFLSLMKCHFAAVMFVLRLGVLEPMNEILRTTSYVEVAEAALQIVDFIASRKPERVLETINVGYFFRFLASMSRVDQRICLHMMDQVASCRVDPFWNEHIADVLGFVRSEDPATRGYALGLFGSIVASLPVESLKPEMVRQIVDMVNGGGSEEIVRRLLGLIERLSRREDVVGQLVEHPLMFEKFLAEHTDPKIVEHVLIIIEHVFPEHKLPPCLWDSPAVPRGDAAAFVSQALKIVMGLLRRGGRSGNDRFALQILAACATLTPVQLDQEMMNVFLNLAIQPGNVPFMLVVLDQMEDKSMIYRTGLLSILLRTTVPAAQREWSQSKLHELKKKCERFKRKIPRDVTRARDLKTIISYLESSNMQPFEIWDSDLLERCYNLLVKVRVGECSDVRCLVHLANQMLSCFHMTKTRNKAEIAAFPKRTVAFSIKSPLGNLGRLPVPIWADFTLLEGWYNLEHNPGIREKFTNTVSENPFLQQMMTLEDVHRNPVVFCLVCRAFQVDGYRKCSFKVSGKQFSVFDSVTDMMARICTKPAHMNRSTFDLEITESDIRRAPFPVRAFEDPKFQFVFKVLKEIARCAPEQFQVSEDFANMVFSRIADPLTTLTMTAPAVQLMYSFKELFPLPQRLMLFKMTAIDPVKGTNTLYHQLGVSKSGLQLELPSIRCSLKRESVFEQGCFLLDRIGPGRSRIQFSFQGEPGFGEGPLQEFFTCLCREFCKRDMNMWRDDKLVESEFAVSGNGLFPAVTADNGYLEILGYVCGRALLLDKLVAIPFHPMFFKMVLGEKVALEQVDPMLANSLKVKEGLYDLPFVYPGTNIELKKGGKNIDVNAHNVDEYVSLVESFTCGPIMASKIQYFVKAFETLVHIQALRLFSYDEIVTMICGSDPRLTIEDLRKYVKLEHGYNSKSPEIAQLFEIISEMTDEEQKLFIKFVTGCQRLPYGGLAYLKPPLTVAKRVDSSVIEDACLPSVMTCTNYFKMPAYTSKCVMKMKILQAITECQETFQLS